MTLLFVIVAVYLVVGVLNVMFRNRSDHDYENYHEDPYSYFPRNPGPPAYFTPPPVFPNYLSGQSNVSALSTAHVPAACADASGLQRRVVFLRARLFYSTPGGFDGLSC